MRIVALELNNEIKGIDERKSYIESLIAKIDKPELIVLPELAICSYMACQSIWKYADDCGKDTSTWAVSMAQKYNTFIGVGYLDKENGDYYNRYMIAGPDGVCGTVTKSEGETAVFKNGLFDNIIETPFGNVAVAICYDSKRKHFYDNIRNKEISLILFPHGCPADPQNPAKEIEGNDAFCGSYTKAFGVPVVYVNSVGKLEKMPGKMGELMVKAGFRMNGHSKIYPYGDNLACSVPEATVRDIALQPERIKSEIHFYGNDLINGNWFFRLFVLKPDAKNGMKEYERNK